MKTIFLLLSFGLALSGSVQAKEKYDDGLADRISAAVRSRIRANRLNHASGNAGRDNYVIRVNGANGAPVAQGYFRNGGDAFWESVDTNRLNAAIQANANQLGGTQYYVVMASVFKYGDMAFDNNQDQVNWADVKARQVQATSNASVSGGDGDAFNTYITQLFHHVQASVKMDIGTTDYVINYFLTVFTGSGDGYKVSYRTFITYGPTVRGFAKGFPSLNSQLNSGKVTDKEQWIINNINSDAAYISLYKKNGGDMAVVDFSNVIDPTQLSGLKQLFGGALAFQDDYGVDRHSLKCRLFIVNMEDTGVEGRIAMYKAYTPPKGEMSILVEFSGQTAVIKDKKFGDPTLAKTFDDVLKATGHDGSFWSHLFDGWPTVSAADVCGAIYEMMDWLSKGLSHLQIPAYAWNCKDPHYDAKYSRWFGYLTAPLTFVNDLVIKPYLNQYASAYAADFDNAKFSCICGVWNGIIDFVKAIPEGIKLLTAIGAPNPEWNNVRHMVAMQCHPKDFQVDSSLCFTGFFGVIWEGIKSQHNLKDSGLCKFSYALGNDALLIASIYISAGGSALGVMGETMANFLNVVQKFDLLGSLIGRATGIVTTVVMEAGGKYVVRFLIQSGQELFRMVEENGVKTFYYMKAGIQTAIDLSNSTKYALATNAGGVSYKVSLEEVFANNLDQANLKIKQYLTDAEGNLQRDANGNTLAIVGKDGSEAAEDNAVAVVGSTEDWVVDLSKVKKINGRYPVNSQDYTGKTFSFDLAKNPRAMEKVLAKTGAAANKERAKFAQLLEDYPEGVEFDEFGYPRFEKYAVEVNGKSGIVANIPTAGNRSADFAAADAKLGINQAYRDANDLVWHHVEDKETMILIKRDIHKAVKHTGGIGVYRNDVEFDGTLEDGD